MSIIRKKNTYKQALKKIKNYVYNGAKHLQPLKYIKTTFPLMKNTTSPVNKM